MKARARVRRQRATFCSVLTDLGGFRFVRVRDHIVADKEVLLSIGEAAKGAGVSRQSLQYYLMVGLLQPTEVSPTGRRRFDRKAVERIRLIKRLNYSGYPLRAIRELFMEGRTDWKGRLG